MSESSPRTARLHRSGNSYSIRIPRDLMWPDPKQELVIEKRGDEIAVRPAPRISIAEMLREFERLRAVGAIGLTDAALERPDVPNPWDRF